MKKIFKIRYVSKQGLHWTMYTEDLNIVRDKIKSCFKQRLEATATEGNNIIAKVWRDATQRPMWNYLIEGEAVS